MIKLTNLSILMLLVFSSIFTTFNAQTTEPVVQRVRIDFKSPTNYVRHLLLSFVSDNSATDGVDYGYDARNMDDLPYDLNWIIEEDKYLVQGVGAFHDQRHYPFWMKMINSGEVEISLVGLENFDTEIPVYIYDKHSKQFHSINEGPMLANIEDGEFSDRFHIAFSKDNTVLAAQQNTADHNLKIYFENQSQMLTVDASLSEPISKIVVYNIEGKILHSKAYSNVGKVNIKNDNFHNSMLILQIEQGMRKFQKLIIAN